MTDTCHNSIRLAAVGDLLLTTRQGDGTTGRGLEALAQDILDLFATCDLVFANLECTLPAKDSVPTEPLVLSTEKQIRSLHAAGINVVTLGNNHAFDCFERGFQRVTNVLSELQIPWCGAGSTYDEASCPTIVNCNGISVAFIGAVDKSSGPHLFASDEDGGVSPFDIERICMSVKEVKENVDHVIVSPHWGVERFRIPNPDQIRQARMLVEAGASMILGHHPHVIQGVEVYKTAPIAYSLGNFLANHVYWSNGDYLDWNRFERTGLILVADINRKRVLNVKQIPVFDDGEAIRMDISGRGEHYLNRANKMLARGVTAKNIRQEKFRVQTLKPIAAQMRWSKLKRIRPGHLGKLFRLLTQ